MRLSNIFVQLYREVNQKLRDQKDTIQAAHDEVSHVIRTIHKHNWLKRAHAPGPSYGGPPRGRGREFQTLWIRFNIRDLKQARTATAVNKQLNFTVKNKPHTTNYIYCIFEAYL